MISASSFVAARSGRADEVPLDLQAELLAKVAGYDKQFAARAGSEARVLLLTREGNAESARAGAHLSAALGRGGQVGGVPVAVSTEVYSSGAALREAIDRRKLAVVYLMPGLLDAIGAIVEAMTGADILSVTVAPELVPAGAVLGFDLVSGKPKLLCHLAQARKQNVAFKAEVLKLMKVYE
jgi:hypothetical protein